jgi:outer membrane receptor protein involved in Fe transport
VGKFTIVSVLTKESAMMKSFRVEARRGAGFLPGYSRFPGFCSRIGSLTLAAFVGLLTLCVQLPAQTSLGTILGNVTDESGAAIPHVTVTITNEATNATRTVTTSEAGTYTVPALPAGTYKVQAEMKGFREEIESGVKLEVNQTLRLDLGMKVGEVTQSVEVAATAATLQTDSSTVATTMDNAKVVELPLNGRSFTQLTVLVPGAVGTGAPGYQTSGTAVSVSGLRSENNNYTLDGVNNNESFFKSYGVQPTIDSIEEFRVQTNITSAEFGTGAGANVNLITKSGTNEFHGTAFEFHRDNHLTSQDYFSAQADLAKPIFRQNQFGGVFGGPIHKNTTFFFASYEGDRFSQGQSILSIVPSQAQLSGNLSLDSLGNPAPAIYDPATTTTTNGVTTRMPFPGNIIPANRIDPAMTDYAKIFLPAPNTDVNGNNYINTSPNVLNGNQGGIRVDQRFGNNNTLTGRFNVNDSHNLQPTNYPIVNNTDGNTFTNAMVADTHTFGANTILDVRLGYHRNNLEITDNAPGGPTATAAYISTYGFTGVPSVKGIPLFPQYSVGGNFSVSQQGYPFVDDTWSLMGTVSRITGKHLLKMGWDFRYNHNLDDGYFTGNFAFTPDATTDPQNAAKTGQSMAGYLLGLPNSALRDIGQTAAIMRKHDYSGFVQDDWKVSSRLTLNLGLRYDYLGWPVARDNDLGSFDLTTGQFLWDGINPVTGAGPNVRRGIVNPRYDNFAPRVGFAYRLNDKTTVRGGYGIFYNGNYQWESQGVRGNYPYAISQTLTNLNNNGPTSPIETTFSPILTVTPGANVPMQDQHIINRNNKTSNTQQWNFTVQRRLTEDLILEVGYVGNKGTHLTMFINENTALPGPGDPDPRRPWPIEGATSDMDNVATSTYEGLQVKLEKRFTKGLTFQVNYSFAKTMDVGGSGFGSSTSPQNPNDFKADAALSSLDRANILSLDWVYTLPFGKGRHFGSSWNGVEDAILGGWEVTGILSATSGSPLNVTLEDDIANIGARSIEQRPNLVGNQYAGAHSLTGLWMNPDAYAIPAAYTFGNLGRNTVIGPGFAQLDFGGYKNFRLTERLNMQFRAEIFNITNRVNFGNPNTDLNSTTFGQISGLNGAPLEAQFGLKLRF